MEGQLTIAKRIGLLAGVWKKQSKINIKNSKNTYLEKSAGIGGLTKDAIGLRWT